MLAKVDPGSRHNTIIAEGIKFNKKKWIELPKDDDLVERIKNNENLLVIDSIKIYKPAVKNSDRKTDK